MMIGYVEKFHQDNDIKCFLAGWWVEDKRFIGKNDGIYTMFNPRYPYIYAMSLMYRLYGEPNCIHFKYVWIPMVHIVITISSIFNWATNISHALNKEIERDRKPNPKTFPTFYMELVYWILSM
jgi:hypothetical protein